MLAKPTATVLVMQALVESNKGFVPAVDLVITLHLQHDFHERFSDEQKVIVIANAAAKKLRRASLANVDVPRRLVERQGHPFREAESVAATFRLEQEPTLAELMAARRVLVDEGYEVRGFYRHRCFACDNEVYGETDEPPAGWQRDSRPNTAPKLRCERCKF